jgi:hypothetical protein
LEDCLVQVMAVEQRRSLVNVLAGRRKYPMPRPLPRGAGILSGERAGKLDVARPSSEIALPQLLDLA